MDVSTYFDNISVKSLVARYNVCEANWREDNCNYSYNKFYYFIDGEGVIIIDGIPYHPKPNDLFFIPANTVHTYYQNENKKVLKYWCHFQLNLDGARQLQFHYQTLFASIPFEIIGEKFKRLIELNGVHDAMARLEEKSILIDILRNFFLRVDYKKMLLEDDPFVKEAKAYIDEHITEEISIKDLSESFHFHPNYYIKLFKQHFQMPPIEYVNVERINRAARMLLSDKAASIKQVAMAVGFHDYRYFSKKFKERYGVTPSVFKKRV